MSSGSSGKGLPVYLQLHVNVCCDKMALRKTDAIPVIKQSVSRRNAG